MSKKQLIKDNLLMFIGGNIANGLNYVLNVVLLRIDNNLFNLYTAYTSVSLILLIPSNVTMRVFTVFGSPIISNIQDLYARRRNLIYSLLIVFALALIPLNWKLTGITENGNTYTSAILILLMIVGLVSNVFRGIRQNEEDYRRAVISINTEAVGRLILGFIFAVVFKMGINGILYGHILGLVGSLLVCFSPSHVNRTVPSNSKVRLLDIFLSTLVMTAGLEFFSNFDIIYSNYLLMENNQQQTEFNTLQFFRKIIFFGIFTVSSIALSIGGKNRHSKKFVFGFTVFTGLLIGVGSSIFFLLFKGILLSILKANFVHVTDTKIVLFLIATTLMSTSYLVANWLFTLKRKMFTIIPIVASGVQFFTFILFAKDFDSVLRAFLISSIAFFVMTIGAGLIEAFLDKTPLYDSIENEPLDLQQA